VPFLLVFICIKENSHEIKFFFAGRDEEKVEHVLQVTQQLPMENILVLKYLCSFLKRVSVMSEINKMNIPNLATCFSQTILRSSETEKDGDILMNTKLATEVTQILIENEAQILFAPQSELESTPSSFPFRSAKKIPISPRGKNLSNHPKPLPNPKGILNTFSVSIHNYYYSKH